jgi:hypothetical protein
VCAAYIGVNSRVYSYEIDGHWVVLRVVVKLKPTRPCWLGQKDRRSAGLSSGRLAAFMSGLRIQEMKINDSPACEMRAW